jgi:transporter family protein
MSVWKWYAFASAFFAGLTAILGKIGVAGINSNVATLIRTVVIFFLVLGIVLFRGEWQWPQQMPSKSITFLVLSGVATGLSWLFYYHALQLAPASLVAPIDKLSVAFAIVLGVVFLKETMDMQTALGGAMVVLGAVILAWQR